MLSAEAMIDINKEETRNGIYKNYKVTATQLLKNAKFYQKK